MNTPHIASPVRRGRFIALFSIILAFGTVVIGAPVPAGAATIPNAITDIVMTDASSVIFPAHLVSFGCTWAVPDGSSAGDTFTMQLPTELQWYGSGEFPLADPAGNTVASADISPTGLVTFTLTDFVTTHPVNVHGTCSFITVFTATTQAAPTMTFTLGASAIAIPYTLGVACPRDCGNTIDTAAKNMWWTDSAQTATWASIQVPLTVAQTNTVTIVDRPYAGLALDCTDVGFGISKHIDGAGSITTPNDNALYQPTTWTCTTSQATLTYTNIPAGEYIELWVVSKVTDPTLASYTNSATVTMNGTDTPVTATDAHTDASGTGTGTVTPTPTPTPTTPATPTPTRPATPPAAPPIVTAAAAVNTGGTATSTTPWIPFALIALAIIALAAIGALTMIRRGRSV